LALYKSASPHICITNAVEIRFFNNRIFECVCNAWLTRKAFVTLETEKYHIAPMSLLYAAIRDKDELLKNINAKKYYIIQVKSNEKPRQTRGLPWCAPQAGSQ
jgi:hypothetical protein